MQVRDQNIESPVCDCGIPKTMPSFLDAEEEHAPQILACAFILNINVYFHPILWELQTSMLCSTDYSKVFHTDFICKNKLPP